MHVEVKTNKDELLGEMEEVKELLRKASDILYRLPFHVGLEVEVCTGETTDSVRDTQ